MAGRNGNKTHGRNKIECKRYRDEGRAEKSKARRLLKHLVASPWDDCARTAFESLPQSARAKLQLPARTKSPTRVRAELGVTLTKTLKSQIVARAA